MTEPWTEPPQVTTSKLHKKVNIVKREHLARLELFAAHRYSISLFDLQKLLSLFSTVSARPVQLQVSLRHGWSTLGTHSVCTGEGHELV